MQSIDQKIQNLQDEINLWTSILYPHIDALRQMEGDQYRTFLLGDGGNEEEVSAEFAFESLIAAVGRLRDVVLAGQNFWPDKKDDFEMELPHLQTQPDELLNILRKKSNDGEDKFWIVQLILKRTEILDEALFSDHKHELSPKDLFTMIHRWRRGLAKAAALENTYLAASQRMLGVKSWGEIIHNVLGSLNLDDQEVFKIALRRYLSSEYVFPWLSEQYSKYVFKYEPLFRLAGLGGNDMQENIQVLLDVLFREKLIQEDAFQRISEILGRMASALDQIGNYGELIEQIIHGDGQWGEGSLIGSADPVNIIPSDEAGSCREVLLAFATGRRSPKFGIRAVMRQVREHLIRCGQTRIVIIFTDVWDPEVFAESAGDFKAHRNGFPPKTIIGALVNGNRITPQTIN